MIFKCMNSVVRLSFNLTFAFFRTCGSREQCTGPTEKKAKRSNFHFSMQSKLNLGFKVFRTFILVFIFIIYDHFDIFHHLTYEKMFI